MHAFPEKDDFIKLAPIQWGMFRRWQKRRQKHRHRQWWILAVLVVLVLIIGFGYLGLEAVLAYYRQQLPSVETLTTAALTQETSIYDRDNQLLWRTSPGERRMRVALNDIPSHVQSAFVAIEDRRFFEHSGLDTLGILRALATNWRLGQVRQGASTITQQLARLLFLDSSQTLERKIKEALLAQALERSLSKNQILELYLNAVPFGSNIYGVEAASREFFGKRTQELTLEEGAILAALQKAPSRYYPFGGDVEALKARAELVLKAMVETGALASEVMQAAHLAAVVFTPSKVTLTAPHFVFKVLDELRFSYGGTILAKGLEVQTTLDTALQHNIENIVRNFVATRGPNLQTDNAAAVVLDAKTGQVKAMVGSADYENPEFGAFNATLADRQPGSTLKPFVYGLAFENGLLSPRSIIIDEPITFGGYSPRNFSGIFHGAVSVHTALIYSYNIPAIKTLERLGQDRFYDALDLCGVHLNRDAQLTGVIGGASARLLDVASAYTAFVNNGVCVPARTLLKVSGVNGQVLLDQTEIPAGYGSRILSPRATQQVRGILSATKNTFPEYAAVARQARFNNVGIKTGTSSGPRDAWVVGYSDQNVVAVWAGNHDNSLLKDDVVALSIATPLWQEVFLASHE